jgi:hypothetical protein
MTAADLNSVLWRERELLESLLFHLETEQLILASGRTRWLPRASAQIERTTEALRDTELLRAAQADEMAAELGLAADPSLNALAEAAVEPWGTIFEDQREAFLSITTQIAETASANRVLLAAGQQATREALLALSGTSPGARVPPARLAEQDH